MPSDPENDDFVELARSVPPESRPLARYILETVVLHKPPRNDNGHGASDTRFPRLHMFKVPFRASKELIQRSKTFIERHRGKRGA